MDNKKCSRLWMRSFFSAKARSADKTHKSRKKRDVQENRSFFAVGEGSGPLPGKVWTAKPAIAVLGGFCDRKMI